MGTEDEGLRLFVLCCWRGLNGEGWKGGGGGRSISALTTFLPRKSSRTMTQAIIVPKIALTTTTMAEATSVSLIAASASGLEISRQKALVPPLLALVSSAAIGSSTSAVR